MTVTNRRLPINGQTKAAKLVHGNSGQKCCWLGLISL